MKNHRCKYKGFHAGMENSFLIIYLFGSKIFSRENLKYLPKMPFLKPYFLQPFAAVPADLNPDKDIS